MQLAPPRRRKRCLGNPQVGSSKFFHYQKRNSSTVRCCCFFWLLRHDSNYLSQEILRISFDLLRCPKKSSGFAFPRFFRPLRQPLLPSSATGGGRKRCLGNPQVGSSKFFHYQKRNSSTERCCCFFWLRRIDSNYRPSGYEPDELPLLHSAI